jgi:hypothetical protein
MMQKPLVDANFPDFGKIFLGSYVLHYKLNIGTVTAESEVLAAIISQNMTQACQNILGQLFKR